MCCGSYKFLSSYTIIFTKLDNWQFSMCVYLWALMKSCVCSVAILSIWSFQKHKINFDNEKWDKISVVHKNIPPLPHPILHILWTFENEKTCTHPTPTSNVIDILQTFVFKQTCTYTTRIMAMLKVGLSTRVK